MGKFLESKVKFELKKLPDILETLRENEAIFLGGSYEKTVRYDDENGAFSKKGMFLRTMSGFENKIALKEMAESENPDAFQHRVTEVEVEDAEGINYIFSKLGLTNQLIMEKYRLKWKIKDINISIDELPFGVYLEVKGTIKQINLIIRLMKLNRNGIISGTYWDIFEELKKNNEYKHTKDIKFEKDHIFKIATFI